MIAALAAMRTVGTARTDEVSIWGVGASVAFHALLVIVLALSPAAKRAKRQREESVAVDIMTPQQLEAAVHPPIPEVLTAPVEKRATPVPAPAAPPADPMVRATQMFSAKALANPRSRQARADLATFAGEERSVQLCNIEAMEQIHRWRDAFRPDLVVPYATASEKRAGRMVTADGAVFRSGEDWYGVKFKCELADDGESVVGFEFLVGDPVPRDRWEELDLPDGSQME